MTSERTFADELTIESLTHHCNDLRTQLAAAEQRARYESDVAAQAIARAETAERQIKAGVVSYRPTDGETRAAYGRIHALETELTTLRHRAERMESQIDTVRSLCDDMQDYTALKVLELLDDASACTHTWVDARNATVLSGEVCLTCGAVRAGNDASAGES